jgi:GTP cyclohydrolase IA
MKTEQTKSDIYLGVKVQEHLISLGIETPMIENSRNDPNLKQERLLALQNHIQGIMQILGLDLTDDSLVDTPKRVAKMYLNEIFWGLDYANFPKATVIENKMQVDEMVLERNVIVNSTCEHHLISILGFAHISYIAKDKVLGLSKINRIVEFFSRRPQVQERLASQICETLKFILGTDDVAVLIEAEHLCVRTRGVEDACSDTVTSKMSGVFKTASTSKAEFLSLVSMGKK